MPRSIDRDKLAEKIAKAAFMDPASMEPGSRAKQIARRGALRSLVGAKKAATVSPWLEYDAGPDSPKPPRAEVASGKGKFQARGGRVRKSSGGRVKSCFSTY